jgi:predicted lipase
LVLTGHSLGAAVAVLVARWLRSQGKLVEVATFGSPKIGNWDFANSIDFPVTRVVNHCDIVPHLPPLFDYHHVGEPLWFDSDKKPVILSWFPFGLSLTWQDHHIDRYVELFP